MRQPQWIICFAFLFFFTGYWCVRVARQAQSTLDTDFGVYYRAGEDFTARRDLYQLDHGVKLTFKYAPVVAMACVPLALLGPVAARVAWCLGEMTLMAGVFAIAIREVTFDQSKPRWRWILLATTICTIGHWIAELHCGQSTSLWVFLTYLALSGVRRDWPILAGTALAAAVLHKCVPDALAPYL